MTDFFFNLAIMVNSY